MMNRSIKKTKHYGRWRKHHNKLESKHLAKKVRVVGKKEVDKEFNAIADSHTGEEAT